ncbi:MAG TPA: NAD(P)-dependent oxidoreductase, partial [Kineosporiaceae bacterium]
DTPAAVAATSDIVFTMVGYPSDVREVVLGTDGALSAARPGTVLVDLTTSDPSLAREIYTSARQRDVHSVDAPVSGGDIGARNGTLSIMIGGDADTVDRLRPVLGLMGTTIVHQGGPGSGQHTKMVNQTLIATGLIGVCEALLYAHQAGLDPQTVLESVSGGAAGSWSLTNYAPRMLHGDYAPGFMVAHFIKDLEITLAEARRMDLSLPGLALAHQLYVALRAQGGGGDGVHALIRALARLSAVDWTPGAGQDVGRPAEVGPSPE